MKTISPVPRMLCCVLLSVAAGLAVREAFAAPEITSWKLNTTGATGYGGLPADVQNVRFSDTTVYVNCSSIPDYSIGPWNANPNTPTNQGYLLRFPRSPVVNNGAKTSTPLGPIGSWTNGVAIFNALDARSYLNQNIWHQNAIAVEGVSFDACLGHPAPNGTYHNHENPSCLYGADSQQHSALLGYAFDGFPIYGPYGYANTDGTGGIARMRSSYAKRNITVRQTLPDGTVLQPSQYGPAVSASFPLGYYIEDYLYTAASGDLDAYNGRFAATPDYPDRIYAYYVTVDEQGNGAYPYEIGAQYYGVVATDNITSHGHVTISEAVTTWTLAVEPGAAARAGVALAQNRPNPAVSATTIDFTLPAEAHVTLELFDVAGRRLMSLLNERQPAGGHHVALDPRGLAAGVYLYRLRAGGTTLSRRLLVSP